MPKMTLAARVAALEKELAEVKARLAAPTAAAKPTEPSWLEAFPLMQSSGVGDIMKEALKIRERDRQKTRRRKKVAT